MINLLCYNNKKYNRNTCGYGVTGGKEELWERI